MEAQQQIKTLIDEAFAKLHALHKHQIAVLQTEVETLTAKAKLQTDAETDIGIRERAAAEKMSVEAWLAREIQHAVQYVDMPMIRVHPVFYERLKAYAEAKGMHPEAITTTPETTQKFMSLIENLLI